jgi:hypothetical protein
VTLWLLAKPKKGPIFDTACQTTMATDERWEVPKGLSKVPLRGF